MKRFILYILTFLLAIIGKTQSIGASNYKIYDVKAQRLIPISQFADSIGDFDVLFFGESHNDSVAHYLEDTLYNILFKRYSKVALSMEALSTDHQVVLNDYLHGFVYEEKFKIDAVVWEPFYKGYAKLINDAKENGSPVIAANAPDRYVELVHERGMDALNGLDSESKKLLPPLPYYAEHDKNYEDYKKAVQFSIYFSDSLWQSFSLYNAAMSNSIYRFWSKNKSYKIISVNGSFHSDERLGIVARLSKIESAIKIKTISCFKTQDFTNPSWKEFSGRADFIIVTDPAINKSF